MKTLHLTIMIFCHVLLASIVLYFTTYATASPLTGSAPPKPTEAQTLNLKSDPTGAALLSAAPQVKHVVAESKLDNKRSESEPEAKNAPVEVKQSAVVANQQQQVVQKDNVNSEFQAKSAVDRASKASASSPKKPVVDIAPVVAKVEPRSEQPSEKKAAENAADSKPVVEAKKPVDVPQLTERKLPEKYTPPVQQQQQSPPVVSEVAVLKEKETKRVVKVVDDEPVLTPKIGYPSKTVEREPVKLKEEDSKQYEAPKKIAAPVSASAPEKFPDAMPLVAKEQMPKEFVKPNEFVGRMAVEPEKEQALVPMKMEGAKVEPRVEPVVVVQKQPEQVAAPVPGAAAAVVYQPVAAPTSEKKPEQSSRPVVTPVVVKGGLGPLHLLAATLCNYQPEKPVADETLNELYRRRAIVRKSLFEFMSLKFTNLEKLSSRLGDFGGLAVVPMKTVDQSKSSIVPSHGWPVVGKCTAHDLRLMGEAAWCDVQASPSVAGSPGPFQGDDQIAKKVASPPVIVPRLGGARAIAEQQPQQQQPVDQSAVLSKILRVGDVRDTQTIESSIGNLNLTQQQLASIQAQAASTRECRRNALRYTKAIFNHLAEDQRNVSESWPRLYSLISEDECARKRMIDIITALSGFRSDTTSVRRDNLEFAFAMDDLRGKVLENEVNIPLTFDKQFIEVEQFLQQSVQLMLANIDPERAKITSARYRSLMSGPTTPDDQCIELHQRLMARNYPTDCNPTQFGQLPDVLRMTAHSLELWSIEKELSQRSAKLAEYANYQPQQQVSGNRPQQQTQPQALVNPALPQQPVVNKESVDECIASLVTS